MNNDFAEASYLIHGPLSRDVDYPLDWLKTALEVTGSFEGSGFGNVAGDFDGQGVSVGVLQWNYGQGSLQSKILQPYIKQKGAKILDTFFPEPVSVTATMSPSEAVGYARKKMLDGKKLKQEWVTAWSLFLSKETVKNIQIEAARSLASKAYEDAISNNLRSKRAFCWFFDVHVQNGSMKGINKPELSFPQKMGVWFKSVVGNVPTVEDVVMPFPVMSEYENNLKFDRDMDEDNIDLWLKNSLANDEEGIILFNWMIKRVTRNRWASDVLSRKGTIAHRVGYVHEKLYDLREKLA